MQAGTTFSQAYKQQALTGVQVRNHLVKQGLAHMTLSGRSCWRGSEAAAEPGRFWGGSLWCLGAAWELGSTPILWSPVSHIFFSTVRGSIVHLNWIPSYT